MSKFLIKQAFAEAMDLHRQNRFEEAKAIYNKILTVNESEPNAHHLISLIFMAEGDFENSKKHIEIAINKAPNQAVFHSNYGSLLHSMGEYQLAKAAGFSDIAASFAGREVATDFGMRGSSSIINAINRNTMFFNASIQGLYRTGRVLFEQPKRAAAVITATIVAPEIALYHINNKHKEYSLVPNQVKQLNYLIPNYTVDENGQKILDPDLPFYAIPKPYDLGVFAPRAVVPTPTNVG